MPNFKYKTQDKAGNIEEGVVQAADRFAVYKQVRKEGRTVVSVTEQKGGAGGFDMNSLMNMEQINLLLGRIKFAEKIILTRNLAAMVDAGLVLSRALEIMERQTKNIKLQHTLRTINADVKKGEAFSAGLKKFPKVFSPLFVSMVRAGEESGSLGDSLKIVGSQMEKSYNLQKKVKGAMIYPTIVMIAMVIIGILMLMFVVPTLASTFEELGSELPLSTQAVISVSNFLSENTFSALGIMLAVGIGFWQGLKTKPGSRAFEWFILHVPIIGNLVREVNSARTARTFSSLLSSGVDVIEALSITKDVVQNSYFKEVIAQAEKEIEKGAPISKVFIENSNLYPVLFGEIIAVGEETGKLSDMLEQLAGFYESEVEIKTKDMSTIIEPFLMLFIGGAIGFFAISMISPIYSLSESI